MFLKHLKTKSGEILIIREAIASDAAALIEYVNGVAGETDFLTVSDGDFKISVEDEEEIIKDYNNAKNKIFLIAELNGDMVGLLNVSASDKSRLKHCGDLGISVKKDHWGKGIGSSLMEAMLQWSRDTGIIRKINLNVQVDNELAISLYKKFGFEKEGLIKRDAYTDGQFHDSYFMGILID